MKRPRLNVLRTFEVAARRLSFSAAAVDLKISQAAVSQQIRQLEAYLDSPLFIRHNRRLSLTGTGQSYFEAVHEALDRLDSVTDQLFPGRDIRVVTLQCTASVAALWLAPRIQSFQSQHPGIELRIQTLEPLRGGDPHAGTDLEIFIAGEERIDSHTKKLLTASIVPVCSPAMVKSENRPAQPGDLLAGNLIHVLGYEDDWHRWFRSNGVNQFSIPRGLSVDSSLIAIEAAQRGDGIMLGRRPFINALLESGDLVEIFADSSHLYADYYLHQSPDVAARRECRVVAHWLIALANKSEP